MDAGSDKNIGVFTKAVGLTTNDLPKKSIEKEVFGVPPINFVYMCVLVRPKSDKN